MTDASLLTLAALALALALQPWSVLAAVLLVSSERGVIKEAAYVIGWVLALLVVAAGTIVLYPAKPKAASNSAVLSGVELGVGLAILIWATLRWRRGPRTGGPEQQPKWMGRVDTMRPLTAAALGAFLPNYVFVVAAVTNVLELGVSRTRGSAIILIWVVLASLGVAAPLLVLLVRRGDAAATYHSWRLWLLRNGQAVLLAVLVVVGVALTVKGAVGLAT